MPTPIDGTVEQNGDLELTSPAFKDEERMPDSVGLANENESPPLEIDGVPDDAAALVLAMDDPEAVPVAGHTWEHWLVFNISPDLSKIPAGWEPEDAVVGYNDFVDTGWGGPSPPEGAHRYHFKLFAIADELDYGPSIRKTRVGSAMVMDSEILASTQLVGVFDAEQGTVF